MSNSRESFDFGKVFEPAKKGHAVARTSASAKFIRCEAPSISSMVTEVYGPQILPARTEKATSSLGSLITRSARKGGGSNE